MGVLDSYLLLTSSIFSVCLILMPTILPFLLIVYPLGFLSFGLGDRINGRAVDAPDEFVGVGVSDLTMVVVVIDRDG